MQLPSVVATGLASIPVSRVARRLFGPDAAWPAAVAFAVIPRVAFTAVDARPYAFAYLALVAATLSLLNLTDQGGRRWAAAYGATVGGTVQLLTLGAQIPYLVEHARIRNLPMKGSGLLANPSLLSLLETLIPLPVIAAVALGILVGRATAGLELGSLPNGERRYWRPGSGWLPRLVSTCSRGHGRQPPVGHLHAVDRGRPGSSPQRTVRGDPAGTGPSRHTLSSSRSLCLPGAVGGMATRIGGAPLRT